jgi:integrase
MGQYKKKIKIGERWLYSGQFRGQKYHSRAIYQTKKECATAERKLLLEMERGTSPTSAVTLLEVCEKRLDYLESKTLGYYKDNKRLFKKIIEEWGDVPVYKISREMVAKYLLDQSNKYSHLGIDNNMVNYDLKMLKALFTFAMEELECINRNPATRAKRFPVKRNTKYIPPYHHIEMVCCHLNERQRALYVFCYHSACRISEALRATGDDIDNRFLTLWTKKKAHGDLTPRKILLPEPIAEMKREGKLFPEWTYRPRFLEDACKALDIPVFGWHAFRHRKASIMAQMKEPINAIQHYLGHESIIVTQQYLHLLGYRL